METKTKQNFSPADKILIHKNLNTSFVNLSAMVRHLRSLQFVGIVRVELSSYEAELEFTPENLIEVTEQDHITGRMSFGEDALERILIRSKEPGGLIHVFKKDKTPSASVFVDRSISHRARNTVLPAAEKRSEAFPKLSIKPFNISPIRAAVQTVLDEPIPKPEIELPKEKIQMADNWNELLGVISELMNTIDKSVTKKHFNFTEAFRNACGFVSMDHPFLDPDSDVFSYQDGYISLRQRVAPEELVTGISAAIGRIMSRLREDPGFGNVSHSTMHRVRVLANRRRPMFETFGLHKELQKAIVI